MSRRKPIATAAAITVGLAAVGAGMAMMTSTADTAYAQAAKLPPIVQEEHSRTIAAMKPPKRHRPVVAIIGQNDGTETTDYLIPFAVLKDSGAADVFALATEDRPLKLKPALTIRAQATTAAFDRRYPDGADYVIVPAITDRDHPDVIAWVNAQAAKGAVIVGICAGSVTLSEAGLLKGRSATGHWHDVKNLQKANPTMRWAPNRRYVADRGVVTTTGVSASLPVSLAMVEAIAGPATAAALAKSYNLASWDARHDSSAYRLERDLLAQALANKAAVWRRETYGFAVEPGVDELNLGFSADAWSRTFRSRAVAVGATEAAVPTKRGIWIVPDVIADSSQKLTILPAPTSEAADVLPMALAGIEQRYGTRTAAFVALQLEYPWRSHSLARAKRDPR